MTKIKLLKDIEVVYWVETIEGDVELDGELVSFRYSENSNGAENYIYLNGNWVNNFDKKYNFLFEMCGERAINKDSKTDEKFDSEFEF